MKALEQAPIRAQPLSATASVPGLPGRLRIGFVIDLLTGDGGGGVVSARRFVKQLREHHEVIVIGTGEDGPDHVGMPALHIPSRLIEDMNFVLARPRRARLALALRDVDVVHLQFPFWLSFVALEEARRLGKPVVAALHVQPENVLYNLGIRSKTVARWLFRWWVKHYYSRVDLVVCPTEFAAEKLREHGLRVPTVVVSNGFAPHLHELQRSVDEKWRDRFVIVAVGRYAYEKRQDVLLRALQLSRHRNRIQLVMAGAGPWRRHLSKLAARLPNPPEMGHLDDARLEYVLSVADLFVHCSEVELEGMAVVDAMSLGLPALIAQAPQSAASRFAVNSFFAFPAGDPVSLAQHIDTLIEQPERMAEGAVLGQALARSFDFHSNVDRLVEVYREACRRNPAVTRLAPEFASSS